MAAPPPTGSPAGKSVSPGAKRQITGQDRGASGGPGRRRGGVIHHDVGTKAWCDEVGDDVLLARVEGRGQAIAQIRAQRGDIRLQDVLIEEVGEQRAGGVTGGPPLGFGQAPQKQLHAGADLEIGDAGQRGLALEIRERGVRAHGVDPGEKGIEGGDLLLADPAIDGDEGGDGGGGGGLRAGGQGGAGEFDGGGGLDGFDEDIARGGQGPFRIDRQEGQGQRGRQRHHKGDDTHGRIELRAIHGPYRGVLTDCLRFSSS